MRRIAQIKNLPLRVFVVSAICWFVWEIALLGFWAVLYLIDALSPRFQVDPVFGYLFLYFIVLSWMGLMLALISVAISIVYWAIRRVFYFLKGRG